MKPRTKFQQNVVAAKQTPAAAYPRTNRMGVQELHRAYRTPHAERTYHLHRVRPHVAERKRRTHGQSVRVRVSALPHHAESGNHPAPQVQRLRVFVHRNPLQGFSSPALRLYRVLGESGTTARLHPYRSRTAVDAPTDAPQLRTLRRWASSFTGGVGRAHWNCGRRTTGNTTSRPHASIPGNGLSPNCAEAATANNSPM